MTLAIATILAKNYLAHARVLAQSLRRHHPGVPFLALLIDDPAGCFDPPLEPFEIVALPPPRSQRTMKELAAATKPAALQLLLDRGFTSAVFLDPDILVRASLDGLFAMVASHAVTLTPHLLAPLAGPGRVARELNILQSGTFNAGFIGVTESASARRFLGWWRERVTGDCEYDVGAGVYYDQRWLDLAPVFFEDVFVVRDAAYNVAHWNLPERALAAARFVHFSGFDPERPSRVTRYSGRVEAESLGAGAQLFADYAALLHAAGYREATRWVPRRKRDQEVASNDREVASNDREVASNARTRA